MSAQVPIQLTRSAHAAKGPAREGKILLVKPPYFTPWTPPLGIAILKSFVEQHRFSARCFDFNVDPELWGMHHKYFSTLQELEDVSINDGYSKLWWILNAHMLARANGADHSACERVLETVIPLYRIGCDRRVIGRLIPLVERFFARLEELIDEIDLSDYSVVGTSTYTTSLAASLVIHRKVKERDPSIKTVMGGGIFADDLALGSDNLETLVREYPFIDHVVLGEGELLLLKLLNGELAHKRVLTLADLKGASLQMKDVPAPDFSDLDNKIYYHLSIEGARSCPFQCSFCSETIQWGEYRKKPADLFIDQVVELARRYDNRSFFMGDSLMNPYINQFANELIRRDAGILYDGYLRADKPVTHRHFVKAWAASGLFRVRLGIESASARVLDSMDKMTTPQVISDVLKTLAGEGIRTTTYWIVGFPGETEEDFRETCEFIREHHRFIYEMEAHPYYYYPYGQIGSRLYQCDSLYPESVTDVIKFKVWDIVGADPPREVRYERLRHISRLAAELGLPNIYTMAERYEAEDRWFRLHPLAAQIYEGTRPHRGESHPLGHPVEVFTEESSAAAHARCYRVSVSKPPDEALLAEAAGRLLKYEEMLQVRLDGGKYVAAGEDAGADAPPASLVSVFERDGSEGADFIPELAARLSSELLPARGRSLRVALVKGPAGACELLLLVHGAVSDAKGAALLCEELYRIHEQLSNGKEVSLRLARSYLNFLNELMLDGGGRARAAETCAHAGREGAGASRVSETFGIGAASGLFDVGLAAFDVKPFELFAAAALKVADGVLGDALAADLKMDYRHHDPSLGDTVGVLTRTLPAPAREKVGGGTLADLKCLKAALRSANGLRECAAEGGRAGLRVLLDFEYLFDEPWLGGVSWSPQGVLLPEGDAGEGHDVVVVPFVSGGELRVRLSYRDEPAARRVVEALKARLEDELKALLDLAERYVSTREFWQDEFGAGSTAEKAETEVGAGGTVGGVWERAGLDSVTWDASLDGLAAGGADAGPPVIALAAFSVLLSRVNSKEDIFVLALDREGRGDGVPLNLHPYWEIGFAEYVGYVERKVRRALANEEHAIEVLTGDLPGNLHAFSLPALDAAFVYGVGGEGAEGSRGRLLRAERALGRGAGLTLEAARSGGNLRLDLLYDSSRFERSAIEKLADYWNCLVSEVGRDANVKIGEIAFEREQASASPLSQIADTDFVF